MVGTFARARMHTRTAEEACSILGVEPWSSQDTINEAYRFESCLLPQRTPNHLKPSVIRTQTLI